MSFSALQGINLVPLPFKSTVGNTVTCLADNFKVTFQCGGKNKAPKDLRDAAERMVENLRASKMRYLSPSYGAEFFPKGPKCEHKVTELKITVNDGDNTIASHATKPVETRAATEGYKLSIPADGSATVSADTALGAFRGLVSFENLFYKIGRDGNLDLQQGDEDNDHGRWNVKKDIAYAPFAPYELDDKPQFPWRSVLLDTSRNYFRKEKLFKMLDAMSKVKLNVFHWHITDSQSWPLDLKAMPELVKGAYQGSRIYSESDVKEVVAYAAARGIDVVIEIDTPGHTASLYASHPEYIACNEASPWAKNANEPPAGQLRFADDEVTAFTSKIFANTIALTQSAYFGTGGDELNLNCMNNDGPTNATLQAKGWTLMDALREFTNKTHNTLLENKRTPMVWEEMVLDHGELNVVKDTIVDVWISSANVRAVADKGYRVVHASSDYFYLDCGHGGWVGKDGGLNSWCDPFKSWQLSYSFNPYNNLTEAQHDLILGGQASLWCEQTDEQNFETVIWPRAAAIAELWWTGSANTANGSFPRSSIEAFPRMHDVRYRLVDSGINAVPLQPEWCALRPHMCDLEA